MRFLWANIGETLPEKMRNFEKLAGTEGKGFKFEVYRGGLSGYYELKLQH